VSDRPRLLDLFCGAGGAGMGYHRAGFDVTGVDIRPMPRYPFTFHRGDALEYLAAHGAEYDVIHASPPCQGYSVTEPMKRAVRIQKEYPMLVDDVRRLLIATGKPYVIENVPGAPLVNPLRLSGAMFGLKVRRVRLFETNPPIYFSPAPIKQTGRTAKRGEYERGQHGLVCVAGNNFDPVVAQRAMGIDWMIRDELAEAIPPAYTEYIGKQIIRVCHETQSMV
jgi:DNA (cytosine-5)-methyltransferase 1